jgi:VIT1/CCC1 family predicted Fe2+/Mn2+ transporter
MAAQAKPRRGSAPFSARDRRRGATAEAHSSEHHHRNVQGGTARAAVFGISDGLVTNVSIVLGVAGAHPAASIVRLAGLVSLVGGAFSMAAGEYVSMSAQRELAERELEVERREISRRPESERRELAHLYEQRGLTPEMAASLAEQMMRDPDLALETHAREELGIDPSELGRPLGAAVSSFVSFAVGALVPLAPWLGWSGNGALIASLALAVVAAIAIGLALSGFTGRSWWRSSLRQLGIAIVAAGVPYLIGHAVGATGVTGS